MSNVNEIPNEINQAKKFSQYNYLLDAINIFSETLSLEHIFFATEEIFNTIFGTQPTIYHVVKGEFKLVSSNLEKQISIQSFPLTDNLKSFAVFSAFLMSREQIKVYFPEALVNELTPTYALPLITSGKFVGVIFLKIELREDSRDFDTKIMDYLMRLIKIALEKYEKTVLETSFEQETRSKYFSLKSLNALSHELFKELNLKALFNLAVDAFLELTMAEKIAFVVYDEKSEEFRTKAFKSAMDKNDSSNFIFRKLYEGKPERYRIILDFKNYTDRAYFDSLFQCVNGFDEINDYRYVTLIFDQGVILGFLFITQSVNGSEFTDSLVDVVDILSTNTFLAMKNAKLFEEVLEKNEIIEAKLNNILRLNNLMNNINSAENSKILMDLVSETLSISFDVKLGFLAVYDKNNEEFTVESTINMETLQDQTFKPNGNWSLILKGDSFVTNSIDSLMDYFPQEFILEYAFDISGILIKPLCIGYEGVKYLGVLCLFEHKQVNLSDYEFNLYVDSIVNHATPVLWNLLTIENLNKKIDSVSALI